MCEPQKTRKGLFNPVLCSGTQGHSFKVRKHSHSKIKNGAGKMAHWLKASASKPGDSVIPGAHMVGELADF